MLNIGNLTASQFIQRNMSNQIKEITETTERLSSGKRINKLVENNVENIKLSEKKLQDLSINHNKFNKRLKAYSFNK